MQSIIIQLRKKKVYVMGIVQFSVIIFLSNYIYNLYILHGIAGYGG